MQKRLQNNAKSGAKWQYGKRIGYFLLKSALVATPLWMLAGHVSAAWPVLKTGAWPGAQPEARAYLWLAGAVLLLPLNWGLEALKWQLLLRAFQPVPFRKVGAAVLAGVALSIVTPGRVGEYGGRMWVLGRQFVWGTAVSTLLGSACQWVVLLLAGGWGIAAWGLWRAMAAPGALYGALALAWATAGLIALALFNVRWVLSGISFLPWPKWRFRLLRRLLALRQYRRGVMLRALGLAALRYAVYATQYYLLLGYFGLQAPGHLTFAAIATIFLIQSGLPLSPLAGLPARGELARLVWAYLGMSSLGALAAAYTLFILNLGLPALIGATIIILNNQTNPSQP